MVNLTNRDPYPDFVDKAVGAGSFFYSSFKVNKILADIDVYVSIPKMKEHFEAGVTGVLKNQVGMVPKQLYVTATDTGRRAAPPLNQLLHVQPWNTLWDLSNGVCASQCEVAR
jgi:uncharacterized protein (DUF362 family)